MSAGAEPSDSRARRFERLLGPALILVAVVCALGMSRQTGPSFDELARLQDVDRAEKLVTLVASSGPAVLTRGDARALLAELRSEEPFGLLLAAWSRLSVGRIGLVDPLTSARLPWLLLAALSPWLIFSILRRSRGPFEGVVAGLLLLFTPRFLHAAALGSESAAVVGCWLLVLAAHFNATGATRGSRRLCWSIAAAALLALGVALSRSALWVVPLAIAHTALARWPATRRLSRHSRFPLPVFVAVAALLVPLFVILTNPSLWGASPTAIARTLLTSLEPEVRAVLVAGKSIGDRPIAYAATWLAWTFPATSSVCAVLGLAVLLHRALARKFASGRLRPPRDPIALGSLVALGLLGTLIGPALVPSPLVTFPPRTELALPFLAIAAAIGLSAAVGQILTERRARAVAGGMVVLVAWLALRAPGTGSASFSVLLGGARRAASLRILPVGDGSELSRLAPALDALGQPAVGVVAPDVSPELWAALRRAGRMKVAVHAGQGPLRIVRGREGPAPARAEVRRDGAVLWSLRD